MVDDFKGRGGSPWGSSPGGGNGSGRGPAPPDIDAIIKKIQDTIKNFYRVEVDQAATANL